MRPTKEKLQPPPYQELGVPDRIFPISSTASARDRERLHLGRREALGASALILAVIAYALVQRVADSGHRPPVIDVAAVSADLVPAFPERPLDELQQYLQDNKPAIDHTWTAIVLRPVTLIAWVKAKEGVNLRLFPSAGVDKDGVLPVDTPLGPVDTFVIERNNQSGQVTAVWVPVETDQGRKFSAAAFCLEENPQQLMDFRNQVTGKTLSFGEFLNWIGVSIEDKVPSQSNQYPQI